MIRPVYSQVIRIVGLLDLTACSRECYTGACSHQPYVCLGAMQFRKLSAIDPCALIIDVFVLVYIWDRKFGWAQTWLENLLKPTPPTRSTGRRITEILLPCFIYTLTSVAVQCEEIGRNGRWLI
jgi:hypothetical protein